MTLTSYDLENRFDQCLVKPINAEQEQVTSARDIFAPGLHICPHCTGSMLFAKGGSRDKEVAHILLDRSYQASLTSDRIPEVKAVLHNLSLCSDGKLHPDIGLGFVARGKISGGYRAAHYAHGPGRSSNCGKHAFHDSIAQIIGSQIKRETLQAQPAADIKITPDKRMDPLRRRPDLQVVVAVPGQPVTKSAVEIQLSGLSLKTLKERTCELGDAADSVVWLFKHREFSTAFYTHAEWLLRHGYQCKWIKISKNEPIIILPIDPHELTQRNNKSGTYQDGEQEDQCNRYEQRGESGHSRRLTKNEGLDIRTPVQGRVGLFDPLPILPLTPREIRQAERQRKVSAREAKQKKREADQQAERKAAEVFRRQQEEATQLKEEERKNKIEALLRETLERFPEHLATAIKNADNINLHQRLVRVRLRAITENFSLEQIHIQTILWLVHMSESLSIRTISHIAESLNQQYGFSVNATVQAINAVLSLRSITVKSASGLPLPSKDEQQIQKFIRDTLSPKKEESVTTRINKKQIDQIQYRETHQSSGLQECLRKLSEVKDASTLSSLRYNYRDVINAAIEKLKQINPDQHQRIQELTQASMTEVLKLMGEMRPDPRDRIEKWLSRLNVTFNPASADCALIRDLDPAVRSALYRKLEKTHQENLAARKAKTGITQ